MVGRRCTLRQARLVLGDKVEWLGLGQGFGQGVRSFSQSSTQVINKVNVAIACLFVWYVKELTHQLTTITMFKCFEIEKPKTICEVVGD